MSETIKRLRGQWSPENRYSNFGAALRKISIDGFRGLDNLELDFEFPVTALSGLNGSGKSTIAQLAVCAYRAPSAARAYKRYYVKDFFPTSVVDPTPFNSSARIKYTYETDVSHFVKDVTVSRASHEWSGYKRQPERQCYYVGFTVYIPKIERRDLSIYRSNDIRVQSVRDISAETRRRVADVLGSPYSEMSFRTVGHGHRSVEICTASRFGASYSENNMGFGEGRVLYIADMLEKAPPASLFILEEPETSLHQDAQHKLANYLLDICLERQHQVILTTHSSTILSALPAEARKFVSRTSTSTSIYSKITSAHARGLLSAGNERVLRICVEDKFAGAVVREAVRVHDPSLLRSFTIHPVGSSKSVHEAVRYTRSLGLPVIGVRDADVGPDPANKIFSLPGTEAPEKEVFHDTATIAALEEKYSLDVQSFMLEMSDVDHHNWLKQLSLRLDVPCEALLTFVAEEYAKSTTSSFEPLVSQIRAAGDQA